MSEIERLLRDDAAVPLPDEGFTARVVEALPSRAAPGPWLRPTLVVGSGVLGSGLAVLLAPGDGSLLRGFADLAAFRGPTPAAMLALGMALALLLSALVLAADPD